MESPHIKHNPHPKMRYEFTLTIHDAPGQVDSVTGWMQFSVEDKRCAPTQPISGAQILPPDQHVTFVVTPNTDGTYTGTVYLDLLQDEDYYGMGTCRWKLPLAGMTLKIGDATFSTSIQLKNILAQESMMEYLLKDPPPPSRHDIGIPAETPASEYAAKTPGKFFAAQLTAEGRPE